MLVIEGGGLDTVPVYLNEGSYRLGRETDNELSFPTDKRLSRHHVLFEHDGDGWTIRDLDSRNGTLLNGAAVSQPARLHHGDRIHAGHLFITYLNQMEVRPARDPIVVVDDVSQHNSPAPAITTNLRSALEQQQPTNASHGSHVRALINAGRELVSHRSVEDLFQIILDISVEAVRASRGVLMTRENDGLVLRANHGNGFRISTTVVHRVLEDRTSLLIQDALTDVGLANRESIVAGQVRSILAVPLQTDDRAIGLIYLDAAHNVRDFTPDDLNLLTVMANIAAIRIEHTRLLDVERAQELLAHDLEQAAEIQRGLLPTAAPVIANFDLAGYNAPCRTVGGDYFDFLRLPDGRIGIAVGDVAGKGMPAALLMCGFHARVQLIFEDPGTLSSRVEKLNRSFAASCPSNRFITFFIAVLDPETGAIAYCNAGHNAPLLLHARGDVERLEATGTLLGIAQSRSYAESCCRMDAGDVLLLFSDGASEASNPEGTEEFGEGRLLDILRNCKHEPACRIIEAINRALTEHTGGAPAADDITLVVVRRLE